MRTFEERKNEIFRRSQARIAKRRKTAYRVILSCIPLVLCVSIVSGYLLLGGFGMNSAAPEAPWQGAVMDSVANGSGIHYGANVPESVYEEFNGAEAPEMMAPSGDGFTLELYRGSKTYSYSEPEIVDMFLNILEGELLPPPGGSALAYDEPIEYLFRFEPERMIREDRHLVKLAYPDGEIIYFTLEDNWLTRQDNQAYILTDEQAMVLHKLMEVEWP